MSVAEREKKIKAATLKAAELITKKTAASEEALLKHYRLLRKDLADELNNLSDDAGYLHVSTLNSLIAQADKAIDTLSENIKKSIYDGINQASKTGLTPWNVLGFDNNKVARLADNAARYVIAFTAADGLQLSDRLWRITDSTKNMVRNVLTANILRGIDAARATQEFLNTGDRVPIHIQKYAELHSAKSITNSLYEALTKDGRNPYAEVKRIMRTEMNRAHGEAYRNGAREHPDIIGEQFLLSDNHPKTDICDMHASINLHGLGPGIYPIGKSPWPAHPNQMSFIVAVFNDEISEKDREKQQTVNQWLKNQDETMQQAVLGKKRQARMKEEGIL